MSGTTRTSGNVFVFLVVLAIFVSPQATEANDQDIELMIADTPTVVLGESYIFTGNVTLANTTIYSLSALTRVKTPSNYSLQIYNRNISKRSSTFMYEYLPNMTGRHEFFLSFNIGEEQNLTRTFRVVNATNSTNLDVSDAPTTSVVTNDTGKALENETSFPDSSNNDSTENIPNATKFDDDDTNATERVPEQTVRQNATKQPLNRSENPSENKFYGDRVQLRLAREYLYEYGPVIINGTINATGTYWLNISPSGSPSFSLCKVQTNGSREFFCELPNEIIEITDYTVEIFSNETQDEYRDEHLTGTFSLMLADEETINLSAEYSPFIMSGDKQAVTIAAKEDSGNPVNDAQVSIRVETPDGDVVNLEAPQIMNGTYTSELVAVEPGIYAMDITLVSGTRYKTIREQFRVTAPDVSIDLEIPHLIRHSVGMLNISGNITLRKEGDFFSDMVDIIITDSENRTVSCTTMCEGYCSFSCPLTDAISFSNYTISARVEESSLVFSDIDHLIVQLDEKDIVIDTEMKSEYVPEEMQHIFIRPMLDDTILTGGHLFVEILDPSDISYRIVPESTGSGYLFSFIGLTPGKYTMNISYVDAGVYATSVHSYAVVEGDGPPSAEGELRSAMKRSVEKIFSDGFVNATPKVFSLPSTANASLEWLITTNLSINDVLETISLYPDYQESDVRSIKKYAFDDFLGDVPPSWDPFRAYHITTRPLAVDIELDEHSEEMIIEPEHAAHGNVTFSLPLKGISKVGKERLIIAAGGKQITDVDYIDADNNGIIDAVSWNAPLADQFRIKALVDHPFFILDTQESAIVGEEVEFTVSYKNANLELADAHRRDMCSMVIANETLPMTPVASSHRYVLIHEFKHPGEQRYKTFCGDAAIEENITIRKDPGRPVSASTIEIAKGRNETLVLTSSSPTHYRKDGNWKQISGRFRPSLRDQADLDSLEYISEGAYTATLRDYAHAYPVSYAKDGYSINTSVLAIGLYNESSGLFIPLKHVRNVTAERSPENAIRYQGVFGNGTALVYTSLKGELKQELIIDPMSDILSLEESFSGNLLVATRSRLRLGGLILDEQQTSGQMLLRTPSFEDPGIYIAPDVYHALDVRDYMRRIVAEEQDGTIIYSGIPLSTFRKLHGTIVFDPTFSIVSTGRDAMSVNNEIRTDYYHPSSPYLFFGQHSGEIYQTGLQFTLDVPKGATITEASLTLVGGKNQTGGHFTTKISVENTSDAVVYSDGIGNISERTYGPSRSWDVGLWSNGTAYTTPDLSSLVQHIIDLSSWASGNQIAFMLDQGNASGSFRSLHDYSTPGSYNALLTVSYIAEESDPQIDLFTPENASAQSSGTQNISFIPADHEGLDTCTLLGNFSGSWGENESMTEIENGSVNRFSPLTLDDGIYSWNVRCNDTMNNTASAAANYTFTIDSTPGSLVLHDPVNSTVSALSTAFNFSASDATNTTCNLTYVGNESETITNISGGPETIVLVENLTVGTYSWNVSCADDAGNAFSSDTAAFNVSRDAKLIVSSDHDASADYMIFEPITFFAEFKDHGNDLISDASCTIRFNDTVDGTMSSYPHTYTREFSHPFNYTYNISCKHPLYDPLSNESSLYVYPVVNASISKNMTAAEGNFLIRIHYRNLMNISSYVKVNDFIDSAFVASFEELPDEQRDVSGGFTGAAYTWIFFLEGNGSGSLNYTVAPDKGSYFPSRLSIVGSAGEQ